MQTDWKQTATAVQIPNFNDNQRPPEASRYTGVSESKLAKLRMARYRHPWAKVYSRSRLYYLPQG